MSIKNLIQFYLFACILFTAHHLFATILEKMDDIKLTKRAENIIIGTAKEKESKWDENQKMILTYIKVHVEQVIEGNLNKSELTLLIPGGSIDNKNWIVEGAPEFTVGEKSLLFIEPEIYNTYRVVGWYQGKFKITGNTIESRNMKVSDFIQSIKEIWRENKKKR